MSSEILDEELIPVSPRRNVKYYLGWVPTFILWIGIITCIVKGLLGDAQIAIAAGLLLVITLVMWRNYQLGIKFILGLILLSIIGLLKFFPAQYEIGFYIGKIGLSVELISLAIGLLHYFTNKKELSAFITSLLNQKLSEKEKQDVTRVKIDGFKRRFIRKDTSDLEEIVNNDELVPEAREAARELINERSIT